MESSSIKINSISIDLAGAANEIDMVKCDHFSIRGFVAETRERDHRKCWPFSEESVSLMDQQSYNVPKFRWWRCMSCIRDIDAADGTKDSCGLHSKSRTISEKKLDENSLFISSKSKSIALIDQEKERNTDIAATMFLKKVQPRSMDASTVRSKSRKVVSPEQVSNKRSKEKEKQNVDQAAMTTYGSSEIAGVVEDTPSKAIKNHKGSRDNVSSESINLAMSGLQRRKTRKVRLLSELLGKAKTKTKNSGVIRKEEFASKREYSVSGTKRKLSPENTSKSCDSESTDSGSFDRDRIKGKQKNRRFQVVDEFLPPLTSQDGIQENDADPGKSALSSHVQRRESKLSLAKKKKNKSVILDNKKSTLISFSIGMDKESQVKPPSGPRDLLNDTPSSLHLQDNDHVRSRDAEANCLRDFGSSSKSNTGGWLRTGVDVVGFSSNNNNTNFQLGHTSSSSIHVADLSCALQKDASVADRKGKTVMVQEHNGAPRSQSHDEIPMEIVELMAKNQYERCLPDKEEDVSKKQPSQETGHKSKKPLLIDLNETYDNGTSLEDNNTSSRQPEPCDTNARNEEHFPIGQKQKSLDFFPISQPYVSSPFGIFPPTQENRPNSIRFSGHNCQWLANQNPSTSSFRVLRACNTCQSSVPNPIWPSSMIPLHGHQKPASFISDHSTMLSQTSTNNENAWNLNFVSNERPIPALRLLSLMDPRVRSNTPADDHHGNTTMTKRHLIQTGDSSKTAYQTKQLPFDFYSKSFTPDTSGKSFPIIPPLGTSSWNHPQEKKTKRKDTFAPVFASSNDQGKFQLLGASNSMMLPLKFHMTGKEKKQKRKAESCSNASMWPLKNNSGPILCSINRNPADFTIPEPGNVYMLTGENLKVRKSTTFKKKPSLCKQ